MAEYRPVMTGRGRQTKEGRELAELLTPELASAGEPGVLYTPRGKVMTAMTPVSNVGTVKVPVAPRAAQEEPIMAAEPVAPAAPVAPAPA